MSRQVAATVSLALILMARAAMAGEAQAPKLDEHVPPTAAADDEPTARALPRALVVCIDRAGRRCWGGEDADDCRTSGGAVFASGPTQGGDPGAQLRSCWDQVR